MFPSLLLLLTAASLEPRVETVRVRSGKDEIKASCYVPAGKGPFPAVVVLHGDFGLTDWVKQQARRIASQGYVALAVDLYRGEVAKDIEEAHILERGLPEERALRDIRAAVTYLAGRADVHKKKLGIIGWDMGGGYALQAACHEPRLGSVVVCYGRLITDTAILGKMKASVLGIFAEKDEGISRDTIEQFRAALKKSGKRLAGLHIVPGVGNGFMDPDSPYRSALPAPAAIARAWQWIDAYLSDALKSR